MVDMFGANAYANADDFVRYPGKEARSLPDAVCMDSVLDRLYECLNNLGVPGTGYQCDRETFIDCLRDEYQRHHGSRLGRNDDASLPSNSASVPCTAPMTGCVSASIKGELCKSRSPDPAHFWSSPQNPHKVPALDAALAPIIAMPR